LRIYPTHNNVLSERNDDKHDALRAKMAAGVGLNILSTFPILIHVQYSGKENEHLERWIDNNIANLINLIEKKYPSTETDFKPVDFAQKAQFFTPDMIGDVAFGRQFGYFTNDMDMFSNIKTTEETIPVMILVGALP
jgi:hypothetical protein